MTRSKTFSGEFASDGQQLGMRLANSIQNYADSNWAEDSLGWNDQKLDQVFDGDLIPTEDQLNIVLLHPKMQKSAPGSDLQILRDWYEQWLEANPPKKTSVESAAEPTVTEITEDVLSKPEVLSSTVTSVTAEVAEVSVEKSVDVMPNVSWAPDGNSVTIGGQVIDLSTNNKPVRTAMFARLNTLKKDKPWRELTAQGDSDQAIYGLKVGSAPITQHRVDHWVKVLRVDVRTLFGMTVDTVVPVATILAEAPATTETEAVTTVVALETTEVTALVEEPITADAPVSTETAAAVVSEAIQALVQDEILAETEEVDETELKVSEQEKSRQYLLDIRHGTDNLSGEVMDLLGDAALRRQSPDFRVLAVVEIVYSMLDDAEATRMFFALEAKNDRFSSLTFGEFFDALRPK